MRSGGNGGWGNQGKGTRQGSARRDCAVAATAAPRLVTAAVPRDLRVDPCEKKSKETSLVVGEKGALIVVGAGLVGISVPSSTPGTPRLSSQKYALSSRGRPLIFWIESP